MKQLETIFPTRSPSAWRAQLNSALGKAKREVGRRQRAEQKMVGAAERQRVLYLESRAMEAKLRQLTRHIITVQEEERKQISRELHDHVVQTLFGINVALSALGQQAGTDRMLRRRIRRTQRVVEKSVNTVHQFARNLRPTLLDDLGLIPALHAYCRTLAKQKRVRIRLTAFGGVEALPITRRTVIFRVAQEVCSDVIRDAVATEINITITKTEPGVAMEICHDGITVPRKRTRGSHRNSALRLVGTRERIEMIGGRLTLDPKPGRCATVRVDIPWKPTRTKKI